MSSVYKSNIYGLCICISQLYETNGLSPDVATFSIEISSRLITLSKAYLINNIYTFCDFGSVFQLTLT